MAQSHRDQAGPSRASGSGKRPRRRQDQGWHRAYRDATCRFKLYSNEQKQGLVYVYIFADSGGAVKIGRSQCVITRALDLRMHTNRKPIRFIRAWQMTLSVARKVEKEAHAQMWGCRIGERPDMMQVGDHVVKQGGDYTFSGYIVAKFQKRNGKERVVVENQDGVLHIFNPLQLVMMRPVSAFPASQAGE